MAGGVGGSVVWNLTADPADFNKGVDQASARAQQFGSELKKIDFQTMAGSAREAFGNVAAGLGQLLKATTVLTVAGTFGFGAMTKAAFGQVKQVENATFALKAYETNGSKVNKVLNELVSYARSDLGVLFQRQDLFDAASTLKIYGIETNKLTGYVKTMSKGVAIGKIGFQELSEVLGRVASEGKLTSDSFDILVRRGIKLPASMRNTAVSAEELFKALDKSLPDSILSGRANTIEGRMIRLQSAFRDLGGAILGVDRDTSKFIKGGLGDQFITLLENLRTQLRDPAMVESFKKMGAAVADFANRAVPLLLDALKWFVNNYETVVAGVTAIAAAFAVAKIGEFTSGILEAAAGFTKFISVIKGGAGAMSAIAAGANPIGLIVIAIVALVAAMVFLELKFKVFSKLWANLQKAAEPVINWFKINILPTLEKIGTFIAGQFMAAWRDLSSAFNDLKAQLQPLMPLLKILGIILLIGLVTPLLVIVATMILFVSAVVVVATVIARVIGWFAKLIAMAKPLADVMRNQVVKNFNSAKDAITSFGNAIGSGLLKAYNVVKTVFTFIFNIIKTVVMFIYNVVKTYLTLVFTIWTTIFTAVWGVLKWVIALILAIFFFVFTAIYNVVKTYLTFIYNTWVTIFTAIWGFLSPILTAIWGFITTVFTAIWNTIKTVFTAIWTIIVTVATAIWSAIVMYFTLVWNTITTIFNAVWSFIKVVWNAIWNTIKAAVERVRSTVSSVFNAVRSTVSSVWNGIFSTISSIVGKIAGKIGEIKSRVVGAVKDAGSWLVSAGRNIIQGLINGIMGMASSLSSSIVGFIKDNVPAPVLKFLGIKSPSKMFAGIGTNIVDGLAKGITQGEKLLNNTSLDMAANVTGPAAMTANDTSLGSGSGTYIKNEIGSITLANDVDADRFIQKLTQQDDIISRGLTPQRYSYGQ